MKVNLFLVIVFFNIRAQPPTPCNRPNNTTHELDTKLISVTTDPGPEQRYNTNLKIRNISKRSKTTEITQEQNELEPVLTYCFHVVAEAELQQLLTAFSKG